MSAPDTAPPVVAYSAMPVPDSISEIVSERIHPDTQRVLIPPVRGWRSLSKGYLISIPLLSGFIVLMLGEALTTKPLDPAPLVFIGVELCLPLLIVILVAWDRLHRRLAIEITPYDFRRTTAGFLGVDHYAWPRSSVRNIALNQVTGKLVIHLQNFVTTELFLTGDRRSNQLIVDELQRAMIDIPAASPAEQQVQPGEEMKPSRKRSILIGTGIALGVIGVVGTVLFPAGCVAWLLPGTIAFGLAFGRQPQKEFWV